MIAKAGAPPDILPDLIAPDLTLWFVGTAAGPQSAARRAYYAKPGNRFWPTLHAIGVTPRQLQPHEFPNLIGYGVGLTDLCKTAWGVDRVIPRDTIDVDGFNTKVRRFRPRALAFTSKTAASFWLETPTGRLAPGRQPEREGLPAVFVLPSPSGLATRWWSVEPWDDLGDWFRAQKRPR